MTMFIKWIKRTAGWYGAYRSDGMLIGEVILTGTSRDNYPWEWSITPTVATKTSRSTGTADTLRSGKSQLIAALA